MTVHVLSDGNYVVVRCHKDDENALRTALQNGGFVCGKTRDVLDIGSLVDINIKRDGSWENIKVDDIRLLASNAGLNVAKE